MWEKGLGELNILLKCTLAPLQHHTVLLCPMPKRWGAPETQNSLRVPQEGSMPGLRVLLAPPCCSPGATQRQWSLWGSPPTAFGVPL